MIEQCNEQLVDAFPNRSFKGAVKLIRLNPTNQQNVVTYDVVINVSNPDKILLPGMTAYVSIAVAERKQVLLLPNAALRFKPANDGLKKSPAHRPANLPGVVKSKPDEFPGKVYVLAKHELKPISVTLGITDSRNTEIIDGELKAGDQVVVGVDQEPATPPSGSATPMRMRLF